MTKMKKINIIKVIEDDFVAEGVSDSFTLPSYLFGDPAKIVHRVTTTFKSRDRNLGVLLSGIKGNQKTTTAKFIANQTDLPVYLITEPFTGAKFQDFLNKLPMSVIFVDEFEKVYSTDELQQEFLTILDGVFQGKKLFLFTTNSTDINQFLKNRLSRIFYHYKFDNLSDEVIDEIIERELKHKEYETSLRTILTTLGNVSIDVLLNFIDEINRFKTDPKDLVKGLNIEIEQTDFDVVAIIKGVRTVGKVSFNPLTVEEFNLTLRDEQGMYHWFHENPKDYAVYNKGKTFVFESPQNKIMFTPFKRKTFEL